MRRIVSSHEESGVLTGEPVMVVDGFRYLDQDGKRLGLAATVLLSLVIVACFRSVRWLVVPLGVVYATIWWTEAALVTSGFRLSMVSSMLWAMIAVMGISTSVHIIINFRELREGTAARVSRCVSIPAAVFWSAQLMRPALLAADFQRGSVHDFGDDTSHLVTLVGIAVLMPGLGAIVISTATPNVFSRARGTWIRQISSGSAPPRTVMAILLVGRAVDHRHRVAGSGNGLRRIRRDSPIVKS
jgi:hypothetical protein